MKMRRRSEWIEERMRLLTEKNTKIAIVPMGKWGKECRDILERDLGFTQILCLDNFHYDNETVFPLERSENWSEDTQYLITVQDEKISLQIETQIKAHLKTPHISKLFSEEELCEIYGKVHLDFLFVGFQKCGTSSLQEMLVHHPQIFLPEIKETSFAVMSHMPGAHRNLHQVYADSSRKHVAGGIEPTYFNRAKKVWRYFGSEIKILMCCRNPKEAAYSLFKMNMRDSSCRDTFYYLRKYGRVSPEVFEEWVEKDSGKEMFRYMDWVKEYLNYFRKENIKIVIFEELLSDTERVMNEIQDFVGVDEDDWESYSHLLHVNSGSTVPGSLAGAYINQTVYELVCRETDVELQTEINNLRGRISELTNIEYGEKMNERTSEKLNIYYKDSINELERFVGKNLKGVWY